MLSIFPPMLCLSPTKISNSSSMYVCPPWRVGNLNSFVYIINEYVYQRSMVFLKQFSFLPRFYWVFGPTCKPVRDFEFHVINIRGKKEPPIVTDRYDPPLHNTTHSPHTLMTPKKRPRTGANPPTVAPIPKSQKPPGELLSSEEKRANHIASVRPRPNQN